MTSNSNILACVFAVCMTCQLLTGCGRGPETKTIHGSVVCGDEIISTGRVSFAPLDEAGRICAAPIVDGQYRIDAQGGAPLGKYRVEIDAHRKTGRKIQGFNGVETAMIDEKVRIGPEIYAGSKSPLIIDVNATFNEQYDIVIPEK